MKENISAKINRKIKTESKKVARARNISFSRLVEIALIHELNRNSLDEGLLAELLDIQEFVSMKIDDLSVVADSVGFVDDERTYLEKLRQKEEEYGYVSVDIVETYARKCGLELKDMVQLMNGEEYQYIIK
mgnify:CR=1 FL=1